MILFSIDSSASDVEIDENFEDSQPATNNKVKNFCENFLLQRSFPSMYMQFAR